MKVFRNGKYIEVEPNTPSLDKVAVVSARQMRLALSQLGILGAVQAFVDAGDEQTHISWEYATEFTKTHPLVVAAKVALNRTDEDIDNIFRLAATL